MLVVFANNQTMTAMQGTTSVMFTDGVPLGANDRASAMVNVHYLWKQGGTATLAYQGQVSNDGINCADVAGFTDSATAETTTPKPKVASVNGGYLRFKYTFTVQGGVGTEVAGVGFDLHVNLDHA